MEGLILYVILYFSMLNSLYVCGKIVHKPNYDCFQKQSDCL